MATVVMSLCAHWLFLLILQKLAENGKLGITGEQNCYRPEQHTAAIGG